MIPAYLLKVTLLDATTPPAAQCCHGEVAIGIEIKITVFFISAIVAEWSKALDLRSIVHQSGQIRILPIVSFLISQYFDSPVKRVFSCRTLEDPLWVASETVSNVAF